MKKIYLSLLVLLLSVSGFAQKSDSLYVYSKGRMIASFLRSKVDSIVYSKIGTDDKAYSDYVTQVISASGEIFRSALTSVDSITFVRNAAGEVAADAIDLGLSVKWSAYNIGATEVEGYGNYFAWGETEYKRDYSQDTYQHWDAAKQNYVDIGSNISGTQYDVAHVKLGGKWRMPTLAEARELVEKCKADWTTVNNVVGYKFTGPNGNSIFLPAAGYRNGTEAASAGISGYYWTSTIDPDYNTDAYYIYFFNGNVGNLSNSRTYGRAVRPVTE